jgi:dTDP-4-amino-4,6-dideoxygalactose transaminase
VTLGITKELLLTAESVDLKKVPFVDLKAQYRSLKPRMDEAIQSVLDRTAFILGPETTEFEAAFARYVGVGHAVGVSSGTDALEIALRACDIGSGDEVITVANTYIATCEAISLTGADVRWVDCDPATYNMNVSQLERAITPRTKAVMPVHLYGQPADMDAIMDVARRHRLRVIEDCAQSHGSVYKGRKTGTFGDLACFSFYPGKNLGAYGDAGAVVTNDDELAAKVKLLRNHGQREKYVHLVVGACHRLDNLQAAVLGVKLNHLDGWNARRRQVARWYDEKLKGVPGVVTPYCPPDVEAVYHLYVVQVPERDSVQRKLAADGIETGIHYPIPLHEQPAYASLGHKPEDFPVSHELGPRILSLPMFPEMTEAQVEAVVQSLAAAVQ